MVFLGCRVLVLCAPSSHLSVHSRKAKHEALNRGRGTRGLPVFLDISGIAFWTFYLAILLDLALHYSLPESNHLLIFNHNTKKIDSTRYQHTLLRLHELAYYFISCMIFSLY